MSKSLKIYIVCLILLITGIMLLDANRPKPLDWNPYYKTHIKSPLGLYVLNEEIDALFKGQKVERIYNTPYEYLDKSYEYDSLDGFYNIQGSILILDHEMGFDQISIEEILFFVGKGNHALISCNILPNSLADSLGFKSNYRYNAKDTLDIIWNSSTPLKSSYKVSQGYNGMYFDSITNHKTKVLGAQIIEKDTLVNFIAVQHKLGFFYIHTQPAAFSNFHLLKDNNRQYALDILSFLPAKNTIYWFQNNQKQNDIAESKLRFIFSQPALKSAWYLFLIGILLFILFRMKRKQRVVDIIIPLQNTTVEFTKTIGNLYFQEGEHGAIIEKKVIYFLERIRSEFMIETTSLNADFNKKLHLKSGRDLEMIEKLTRLILEITGRKYRTEEDLLKINEAIENFWHPKKK